MIDIFTHIKNEKHDYITLKIYDCHYHINIINPNILDIRNHNNLLFKTIYIKMFNFIKHFYQILFINKFSFMVSIKNITGKNHGN